MKSILLFCIVFASATVFAKNQLPEDFCTGMPQEIECTLTYVAEKGAALELSPAEIFTVGYDTTMFCSEEEAVKKLDYDGLIKVAQGKYELKIHAQSDWLSLEIWDTTNGWTDPIASSSTGVPYKDQFDIMGSQSVIIQHHLPKGGYLLAMCVNFDNGSK